MLGWFDGNDAIPVITEDGFAEVKDGWHAVYIDGFYGYVRQNLTAMTDAEPYTPWEGYAQSGTGAYTNYYLVGEPAEKLGKNAVVTVLYDLDFCYLVQIGEYSAPPEQGVRRVRATIPTNQSQCSGH